MSQVKYEMLPIKVKTIEFSENLNIYDLLKIEVYTFDEELNEDKLLTEDKDYNFIVSNYKTLFKNLSSHKIKCIKIYRNPDRHNTNDFNNKKKKRINTITVFNAKYYDEQNNVIACFTVSGDKTIYNVGFPMRT